MYDHFDAYHRVLIADFNYIHKIRLSLTFILSPKVKASPKKLFDTLCFIAGTHSVIESRDIAVQQVKQFEYQLTSVLQIMKKLEKDIEKEEKLIELINKKDKLLISIKDAKKGTELTEIAYDFAKKYASLLKAAVLAREIVENYREEKKLSIELVGYQTINRKGRAFNFDKKILEDENENVDDNPNHINNNKVTNNYTSVEDCQKSFNEANEIVVQMHHIIQKEKKILSELQQEAYHHKNDKSEAKISLDDSESKITFTEKECSLLSKVMRTIIALQIFFLVKLFPNNDTTKNLSC